MEDSTKNKTVELFVAKIEQISETVVNEVIL
jgi:hypothetical protein